MLGTGVMKVLKYHLKL